MNFTLPKELKPVVIIGAGGIVKDAHLPAYKKAGIKVIGIYDLQYDRSIAVAKEFDITKSCETLEELIQIAIENKAVFDLAVPASAIVSVLQRLPDGAGVLVQKPMGEDLIQANQILELCKQKHLIAGVNFQLRHAPYISLAKQLIDNGVIGKLHEINVRICVSTPWHLWDFLYGIERMEILYHSIHYIDMVRYFLGNPQKVYARTIRHPNMRELANTRSAIIMDYGEERWANINTNHGHDFGTEHQESFFKFEGTEGAIKIRVGVYLDYPKGLPDKFEYVSNVEEGQWKEVAVEGSWFPDAFAGPMLGLMCKMEDEQFDYINSVTDAMDTMAVVEAAYKSSMNGGVKFSDFS
ncbi:Gfo/Idh/MocA family oxidoreductase [Fulvivirgaceae bacterium BMA10]|uniref:Gfo/Idh/MocA family oxidoreductase n=1 Tax=Splendidivirga corallicola TaxID=3051826 RepID=A0ABT8KQ54_9BACT|nr:Gfo/Idh/MocA family oxidoreductase [Fulvivirgaceae bacterium BMA10]